MTSPIDSSATNTLPPQPQGNPTSYASYAILPGRQDGGAKCGNPAPIRPPPRCPPPPCARPLNCTSTDDRPRQPVMQVCPPPPPIVYQYQLPAPPPPCPCPPQPCHQDSECVQPVNIYCPPVEPPCCDDDNDCCTCFKCSLDCSKICQPCFQLNCCTFLWILFLFLFLFLLAIWCGFFHFGTDIALKTPWNIVQGEAKFDVKPSPDNPNCCFGESCSTSHSTSPHPTSSSSSSSGSKSSSCPSESAVWSDEMDLQTKQHAPGDSNPSGSVAIHGPLKDLPPRGISQLTPKVFLHF